MQPTDSKKKKWDTSLTYGLYIGLTSAVFMLIGNLVESSSLGIIMQVLKFVATVSLFVYAIRTYRDKQQGGFISFSEAFGMGITISLIATIFQAIATIVILILFPIDSSPQFMDMYDRLISAGLEQGTIDTVIEYMPYIASAMTLFWGMLIGTIYSLIVAASLKKERTIFE